MKTMFIRPTAFLNPLHSHTFPSTILATNHVILSPLSSIATSTTLLGLEPTPTQIFDAVLPDTSLLIGMGSVILLCVVAASVWANEVVPVSRTKLAISKSRGEVREYLDGLQQTNTTVGLDDEAGEVVMQYQTEDDGRGFERWLFSDWLNKPASKGGRQKEPALPFLKDAKWNSGDNPVLVTAGIMMIGIVLASFTERISL
jgi:hypothetical protein